MTLPKSCWSGVILSVVGTGGCGPIGMKMASRDGERRVSGWDFLASGAIVRSAAIATSYATSDRNGKQRDQHPHCGAGGTECEHEDTPRPN